MRILKVALLCLLFLFTFQIFYYAIDVYPLYVLSKILLPISALFISYVLALGFFLKGRIYPHFVFLSGVFFFLVPLSALMGYINFDQPFLKGVAAQLKLVPLFFYGLTISTFKKLHVTEKDFMYSMVILGIISLLSYYSIQLFFDMASWSYDESRVVLYDPTRGYRLNLSVVFIVIFAFYLYRRFLEERKWVLVLFLVPSMIYLVFFWKQRVELIGVMLTLLMISARSFTRRPAVIFTFVFVVGGTLLFFPIIDYFQSDALGYSAALRMDTIEVIIRVLSKNTASLFFGVGNLLRTEDLNFQSLYGPNFWPADVGWLGIVFEYGIAGSLLLAYIYILLVRSSYWYSARETPLIILALRDYVYMTLIISPLVPYIPYLIGLHTTILSIFIYYNNNLCFRGNTHDKVCRSRV